jgi:hypothetical protein
MSSLSARRLGAGPRHRRLDVALDAADEAAQICDGLGHLAQPGHHLGQLGEPDIGQAIDARHELEGGWVAGLVADAHAVSCAF